MTECVVIADELAGACVVGALLERNQCQVSTVMSARGLRGVGEDSDCLVYSTNTRNLSEELGYQMVFSATRLLKGPSVRLYAKRIDPAMRGNTCAETQAMLDALGDNDRVAVVVPAFPALHRSTVGGYMLVNGTPVLKSLAGIDTESEAAASGRVADLFTERFPYHAEAIHLKEYTRGHHALAERISHLAHHGARALVMDCTSQEELNLIAEAVLASGIRFIAVDPGPFTATLARKISRPPREGDLRSHPRILGAIAGSSPLIASQVEALLLEDHPLVVKVHNREFLSDSQRREAEIARVASEILTLGATRRSTLALSDLVGASASAFDGFLEPQGLTMAEYLEISANAYGEIVRRVLERNRSYQAVYAMGADLTLAICRELKADAIHILGQVTPLTTYGELVGGDYQGLKCVASASSATLPSTITDSMLYLKRKLGI